MNTEPLRGFDQSKWFWQIVIVTPHYSFPGVESESIHLTKSKPLLQNYKSVLSQDKSIYNFGRTLSRSLSLTSRNILEMTPKSQLQELKIS